MSDDNFLSRWSRRKHESKAAEKLDPGLRREDTTVTPSQAAAVTPAQAAGATPAQAAAVTPQAGAQSTDPVPLPPIESLTAESDFTPFMQPGVDASVKRLALKKLFEDPRFNVMDGLDVYIDDYTKTTPIPESLFEKMVQLERLGAFREEPVAPSEASEKDSAEQLVAKPEPDPSHEGIPAPPVGESQSAKG